MKVNLKEKFCISEYANKENFRIPYLPGRFLKYFNLKIRKKRYERKRTIK